VRETEMPPGSEGGGGTMHIERYPREPPDVIIVVSSSNVVAGKSIPHGQT